MDGAEQSLAAMLDISWNTNWSELPEDAEGHAEKAFEHLSKARDIAADTDHGSDG